MKTTAPAITVLFSALAVVALTGCATGSTTTGTVTEGGGGDGTDTPGATGGVSECAAGHVWSADVDDMADQLLEYMSGASGLAVQSVTAEGSQLMTWNTDNTVVMDTDYVFTVLADLDDGLVMTMVQSHTGPSTGTLTLDGSSAVPGSWDNSGYTINTTVDINGVSTDMGVDLPAEGIDEGTTLEITCSGSTMTTVAEGGLFSQSWSRTD